MSLHVRDAYLETRSVLGTCRKQEVVGEGGRGLTNIKQYSPISALVYDVVFEHLVVQSFGLSVCGRHCDDY